MDQLGLYRERRTPGLPQGSYEVMVTNVAGCQDSATFTLTDPAPLVVTLQIIGELR